MKSPLKISVKYSGILQSVKTIVTWTECEHTSLWKASQTRREMHIFSLFNLVMWNRTVIPRDGVLKAAWDTRILNRTGKGMS